MTRNVASQGWVWRFGIKKLNRLKLSTNGNADFVFIQPAVRARFTLAGTCYEIPSPKASSKRSSRSRRVACFAAD